jgi:hypothetical protein
MKTHATVIDTVYLYHFQLFLMFKEYMEFIDNIQQKAYRKDVCPEF